MCHAYLVITDPNTVGAASAAMANGTAFRAEAAPTDFYE